MDVAQLLCAASAKIGKPTYPLALPGREKSLYVALALVDRALTITWGSTNYTPAAIAAQIYVLALAGQAHLFVAGSVTGKLADTTENRDDKTYGEFDQSMAVSVMEAFEFGYAHAPYEVKFMNRLRNVGSGNYHAFLFTPTSVTPILDEDISFFEVKPRLVDGDNKKSTSGSFKFSVTAQATGDLGSHPAYFRRDGKSYSSELRRQPGLTLTGGTFNGLTQDTCVGDKVRLTGLVATTTKNFSFAIGETGVSCLTWELYGNCDQVPPTGFTINATTGVVTVAGSVTAGTYELTVIAGTAMGVTGAKTVQVVLS